MGDGVCKDKTSSFKYRKRKNSKKKKRTKCGWISDQKKRVAKKYCDYFYNKMGRDRVSSVCEITCGEIGYGPCDWLEDYDDSADASTPLETVSLDPLDNVFDHSP